MIARDHLKLGTLHSPPGIRHDAIGYEPVVKDIVILETFCPFPLKIKGSLRDQQTSAGLDSRSRRSADVIEFSGLRTDVVLRVIAVQLLAAHEVLEVDMAARFRIACIGV